MAYGTLEVLLVSAKGLENTDFLRNMDPFVILTCKSQEKKSGIVSGGGTDPEWNETFLFTISDGASELRLRIMDKDNTTADDFVGEAIIPLDSVIERRSIPPTSYNVTKDGKFHGEIKVGLVFIPDPNTDRGYHGERSYGDGRRGYQHGEEQSYGGWNQSARNY